MENATDSHGHIDDRSLALERLDDLLDAYGGAAWHGSVEVGNGPGEEDVLVDRVTGGARWVLVEENVGGGFWLTAHDSADDAGGYHVGQEYRGEWEIVELVDLVHNESYQATLDVTWTRSASGN